MYNKERDPNVGALIRLHEFAQAEMTRYRDIEWQVSSIMVAFLFGVSSIIGGERLGPIIKNSRGLQGAFMGLATAILISTIYFLMFAENRFLKVRDLLRCVEEELKIAPLVKKTLSPDAASKSGISKKWVLVIPMSGIAGLSWLLTVWLIWVAK